MSLPPLAGAGAPTAFGGDWVVTEQASASYIKPLDLAYDPKSFDEDPEIWRRLEPAVATPVFEVIPVNGTSPYSGQIARLTVEIAELCKSIAELRAEIASLKPELAQRDTMSNLDQPHGIAAVERWR